MTHYLYSLALAAMCTLFPSAKAAAGDDDDADGPTHHIAAMSGTLTSEWTYQCELSYHFMPLPYVGIGASTGYWRQYDTDYWHSGKNWSIDSDDERLSNLFITPSLLLLSPTLRLGSVGLGVMAEPGLMMNIPYERVWVHDSVDGIAMRSKSVSSHTGRWWAYTCKAALTLKIGQATFALGYHWSNYDIYTFRRHMSYNGVSFNKFYPKAQCQYGAFAEIMVAF